MMTVSTGRPGTRISLVLIASAALAGCFEDDSTLRLSSALDPQSGNATAAAPSDGSGAGNGNTAPRISGTPATKVSVGQQYSFTPRASDPDGDRLSFSASGVPSWLTFDSRTGRLAGQPSEGDVAAYDGIRITVTDGSASASMSIGMIEVVQTSAGSTELFWDPPTMNADGTPLTDLAGYTIRYGTNPGSLDHVVELPNPGITSYVVENLAPTTWYFTISAINSQGVESQSTGLVWTTIG
jgi:hypothetical protein